MIKVTEDVHNVSHRYAEADNTIIQQTGWVNSEGASISVTGADVLTPATLELTWDQIELLKVVLK